MDTTNPQFINLNVFDTYYLSSLSSFSNCDDNTMDSVLVNSEATNMMDGTGNLISGNDIASETV